jgi:hypothetical protein
LASLKATTVLRRTGQEYHSAVTVDGMMMSSQVAVGNDGLDKMDDTAAYVSFILISDKAAATGTGELGHLGDKR